MNNLNTPLFMLHMSKNFFENGTAAAAKEFKIDKNEEKRFDSFVHARLPVPIVNIAFGLEISFKGLLKQKKIQFRPTHDLHKLYKLLDQYTRKKILDHYQSHDVYQKYVGIRLINGDGTEHSKKIMLPPPSKDDQGIFILLKSHKLYFEEFRYLFEFKDHDEKLMLFREFSNLAYSVLYVFGSELNLEIVPVNAHKEAESV